MRDPGRISLGYSSSAREVELGGWSEISHPLQEFVARRFWVRASST